MVHLKDLLAIYTNEEIVNFQPAIVGRIPRQNFLNLKDQYIIECLFYSIGLYLESLSFIFATNDPKAPSLIRFLA